MTINKYLTSIFVGIGLFFVTSLAVKSQTGFIDVTFPDESRETLSYSEQNGKAIHQGDINLGQIQSEENIRGTEPEIPKGISSTKKPLSAVPSLLLWPNGVVPYEIKTTGNNAITNPDHVEAINDAVDYMNNNTFIEFTERNREKYYVQFKRMSDKGCRSNVGYRPFEVSGKRSDITEIEFGEDWCFDINANSQIPGIIVHEMGHAIGLWHEQSRNDRDDFIDIIILLTLYGRT